MQQIDHSHNIIELNNVAYSYGKNEPVINGITFAIHKGDYLGLIGPNGAGKSTLLKLILGILKPTSGHIRLFDTDIRKFKDWSKIGYISQQVTHIDPNFPMTVEEVVDMGRYPKKGLFRFLNQKDHMIVKESLIHVGMLDYKKKLIGDLSGGQQQRVFIDRALAGEPEVIVLDEPTTGVDEKTQKQFYSLMQKLNQGLHI